MDVMEIDNGLNAFDNGVHRYMQDHIMTSIYGECADEKKPRT